MSQPKDIPDLETRNRHAANMREACRQIDSVTISVDELIAQIESDIRNSELTTYRLDKPKKLIKTSI